MKVLVSNKLELLSDALYAKLFEAGSAPLSKRWVIVPSEDVKVDLYLRWLEKMDVIAGIQTITYDELIRKMFPEIPSKMELALRLETALSRIEADEMLSLYLGSGEHLRKLDLAEELSSLFLKYLQKPAQQLLEWREQNGWQQTLWKEVFGEKLPFETKRPIEGLFYFYQIEEIFPYQWKAFLELESYWFLFSPSEMYLGDFQTQRQQLYILRKTQGAVREELLRYFEQDSPLLSNWAVSGRNLFHYFEEIPTDDLFEKPPGDSALHRLQREWLEFEKTPHVLDESIQLHSVPSLLREVEVVWEIIQRLPDEPRDILVLAPDIQPYAAAIEWVFKERGGSFDYTITGIEAKTHSLFLQGIETLLSLPKFRYSRQLLEKLLLSPPFLKRFDLSLEEAQTLRDWMQETHLRYDLTGAEGSWEMALKRAIESLVLFKENPSIYLDCTKATLLNRWIEITLKIREMMAYVSDQKLRTGHAWADWLETFVDTFLIGEEETDVLSALLSTLRSDRVQGLFPYQTIERLLLSTLTSRTGSMHKTTPQAIRFTSLRSGSITPTKNIVVMGMQEGSFPRLEPSSSLPAFPLPNKTEQDRYLFLQALSHAQDRFILTYARCHADDGKEMHPSSLVEELEKDRGGLLTFHHPVSALDPSYYQSETFHSLSSVHYQLLTQKPLLTTEKWQPLPATPLKDVIDLRILKKLARHPVQCFFETSLGLQFNREESDSEFLFSPLEMHRLRTASLDADPEELIEELEHQGKLPTGTFREATLQSIQQNLTDYRETLEKMNLSSSQIFSLQLTPLCQEPMQISPDRRIAPPLSITLPTGETKLLQGTIDNVTEKGLLFHGDDTIEDLLKIWPLLCTVQAVLGDQCSSLFLTKKGVVRELRIENPLDALSRYVGYLQKNLQSPSPLLPDWGRRLLKKGEIPEATDDPLIEWAQKRNLLPPSDVWIQEWKEFLQEVVRELV